MYILFKTPVMGNFGKKPINAIQSQMEQEFASHGYDLVKHGDEVLLRTFDLISIKELLRIQREYGEFVLFADIRALDEDEEPRFLLGFKLSDLKMYEDILCIMPPKTMSYGKKERIGQFVTVESEMISMLKDYDDVLTIFVWNPTSLRVGVKK